MKSQIEFTAREQYVLNYFRDPQLSRNRRIAYDGSFLVVTLALVVWGFLKEDYALGFVGYVLLFWRVAADLFKSGHFLSAYRGIFEKYEAKLKELSEKLESKQD